MLYCSSSVICPLSRFMAVSSYCSNAPVFSCFLQICNCNSSLLISRLLTVSFFYLLFFYPTSFLQIHHTAVHHAVTHDPSIHVHDIILCSIFNYLLEPYSEFPVSHLDEKLSQSLSQRSHQEICISISSQISHNYSFTTN